jgi:ubiquinone/menaquinone biosynthesis C-methylase UbiE
MIPLWGFFVPPLVIYNFERIYLMRGYQFDFSFKATSVFDTQSRERKARTIIAVLNDYLKMPLKNLSLLDVGGSTGIIDNFLADYFGSVIGIDIDTSAIDYACHQHAKSNLSFLVGDAICLEFPDNTYDVVICTHIYEHVPDPQRMMDEILRVLKPGGICYFAAGNRLMWNEPHYNLPLLSVVPRSVAHKYLKLVGKADYYYERHFTYWGLRRLVRCFAMHDYTRKIIDEPQKYFVDYMISPSAFKLQIVRCLVRYLYWLMPGYIWVLEKPPQVSGNFNT